MASNPKVSSVVSGSDGPLINPSVHKFAKKDTVSGTIKLKKQPSKQSKSGGSKDTDNAGDKKKADSPSDSSITSQLFTELDDKDKAPFLNGKPLTDTPDYSKCKSCGRPILKSHLSEHITNCLKQKSEKLKKKKDAKETAAKDKDVKDKSSSKDKEKDKDRDPEGDPDSKGTESASKDEGEGDSSNKIKVAKKSAVKEGEDPKKSKKRKAEAESEKAPKLKKKKEEPKPKVPKPKEAAINANAPLQDDADLNSGPVDSDDEKEQVMAALARYRPRPLESRVLIPTRRKAEIIRVKEILSQQPRIFDVGDWAKRGSAIPTSDTAGLGGSYDAVLPAGGQRDPYARKPSLMHQAISEQNRQVSTGQAQRKPSTASAAPA
ncbi:MAG: hypothetical protein M1824_003775 [Vezdaea acicularis]|nr:MAG: hypothetical protein M1824_003775 [Vezdaea acicularis]